MSHLSRQSRQRYVTMSPTIHDPSSRGGVSRWAVPPQSMQMLSGRGERTVTIIACQTSAMRVVAGRLRGRRIDAPEGDVTRPTTDKVREAVFNALGSLGVIADAVVVDLFAGSGALGIEALSRGASRCTFVDNDRRASSVLRGNLAALDLLDGSSVVNLDLKREAAQTDGSLRLRELVGGASLVLADPPYGFDGWAGIFSAATSADPDVVLIIETEARATVHRDVPRGWKSVRQRDYGRTTVGFYVRNDE